MFFADIALSIDHLKKPAECIIQVLHSLIFRIGYLPESVRLVVLIGGNIALWISYGLLVSGKGIRHSGRLPRILAIPCLAFNLDKVSVWIVGVLGQIAQGTRGRSLFEPAHGVIVESSGMTTGIGLVGEISHGVVDHFCSEV